MKFPSIFRTAKPMRFDIKPRYYDPVKEEIEQRTAKIKRQLQSEGKIKSDEAMDDAFHRDYGSSIRGAFTQGSPIKGRSTTVFNSAGLMRLIIFVLLLGGGIGYLFYGIQVFYAIILAFAGVAMLVIFFRLRRSTRR